MSSLRSATGIALRTAATLLVGAAGGWVAAMIALPLPWMIGSLLAVGTAALCGVRVIGHGVHVPQVLRNVMIPVVGVMIGGAFTPEVVGQIPEWWITILGLVVFMVVSTFAVYALYHHAFGLDPATAYFSAIPGGLITMAVVGEAFGGDARTISLAHFCRLVLAVLLIPLVMRMIYGPVGSAVLDDLPLDHLLRLQDVALLIGAGIVGALGGQLLRIPGAMISGPMLLSAAIHAAGLTHAVPPNWLVFTAQLVIGASLGARFAGISAAHLRRIFLSSVAAFALMLTICLAMSAALAPFVREHLTALVLAYAPGGFAEMSLIALSLNIGIAFVAAHHMARIILAVVLLPAIWRRTLAPRVEAALADGTAERP